jgi:DNA-binding NarL/FixJ family response regulator
MKSLSSKPTVLLADDHQGILNRVSGLLADEFEVIAQLGDGAEVLHHATRLQPDAVILDFFMPTIDGIHAARELRKRGIRSAIIFLTMQRDPDYMDAAEEIKAGYVLKTRMQSDLLIAIRQELLKTTMEPDATPVASLDESLN